MKRRKKMKRLFISCMGILAGLLLIYIYMPLESKRIQDSRYPREIEKPRVKTSANIKVDTGFGNIPLYFIPNKGQVAETAEFYAKTPRYTLWMTKKGLVFDTPHLPHSPGFPVSRQSSNAGKPTARRAIKSFSGGPGGRFFKKAPLAAGGNNRIDAAPGRDVSRLIFLNANPDPEMAPVEMTRHKVNYFMGKDPPGWQKGISTSKAVLYKNIYNNIDLKVYGNEKQIEYDWIVKPGGEPGDIRFEYKNIKAAEIDNEWNLVIETKLGKLVHKKPVSYQRINGEKVNINSHFEPISKNIYGFRIKAYDRNYELIIDPVVTLPYSTFLGGSSVERGKGIGIDGMGHIYVAGYTGSSDYPLENQYQDVYMGNMDVFVSKFNPGGTGLVFSTFFGGSDYDYGYELAVSPGGDVFVTGYTHSDDFPASNNFGGGDHDAFVSKFDSWGNMEKTIYLGGTGLELANSAAADRAGNVYVIGATNSSGFPLKNAYQSVIAGGYDVFITKCDRDLNIVYSTFFGGSGGDFGTGVAVGALGALHIAGHTHSSDLPTKNAYQPFNAGGGNEGFAGKFSADGQTLIYSTYLGGADTEFVHGIDVDNYGCAYIVGEYWGNDFPTLNAFQDTYAGGGDGFIAKLSYAGSRLVYSSYLGGSGLEQIRGIAVDRRGNAFVTGVTTSADFPLEYPRQDTWSGGHDVFVARVTTDGTGLVYSTYLGGAGQDYSEDIVLDDSNNVYITGGTSSAGFPLYNAYQSSLQGGFDAFVSKLAFTYQLAVQSTPNSGAQVTVTPVDIDGNGSGETYFRRTYNPGEVVTLTAPGTFKGNVFQKWTIDGKDYNKTVIQITMDSNYYVKAVYEGTVEISLSRTCLYFATTTSGINTGEQSFFVSLSDQNVDWNAFVSENSNFWFSPSPSSGRGNGKITIYFSPMRGNLLCAFHDAVVMVYPSPYPVFEEVGLKVAVYDDNVAIAPFGGVDTPQDGATVMGSIPVTGWALDNIGVESVKIYREQGKELVYIGDAVFVEDARPDVELAYPTYPRSYRAGWGYMMLTNFLPGGGNGTFVIHAVAEDKEGNKVTLGKKTIICDNAHAVKPFGAIDTPAQGGTASGASYVNFGWVLTPRPNTIPIDGSTINVWIDGVNVGSPVYNNYRADIAGLFPGYANSSGAVGYFNIDTGGYENGVHTIQWTALDSAGNVDGIGSRYFTIQNTGESRAQRARGECRGGPPRPPISDETIPIDYSSPVRIKKDVKENIKYKTIYPNPKGIATIRINELQRVEIHVAGPGRRDGKGFQLVGEQLRPLPVGSTFDAERGVFYWLPGPGFIGTYRLVFIEERSNGEMRKTFVNVKIGAR
jgi:hypothetical protein